MWAGECHKRFNNRASWKGRGMALMNVCEKEWNRFEKCPIWEWKTCIKYSIVDMATFRAMPV